MFLVIILALFHFAAGIQGDWNDWQITSSCSSTCGGGSQNLRRTCKTSTCKGDAQIKALCNLQPCPIDGNWGPWLISTCSTSCGNGKMQLVRICDSPSPTHGGNNCAGEMNMTVMCKQMNCPVDGNWGEWVVSESSLTCGDGLQSQVRSCDNPEPAYGGKKCIGESHRTIPVSTSPCPVDGNWGPWKTVSPCCGDRKERLKRVCDNPSPTFGGNKCIGSNTKAIPCLSPTPCPIAYTKILVALGYDTIDLTDEVEIIDLWASDTICQNLENFPSKSYFSVGSFSEQPLICQGAEDHPVTCHIYEEESWKKFNSPNGVYSGFAMIKSPFQNNDSQLFITGGYDDVSSLNSSQVLTRSGWKMSIPLPDSISYPCLATVNSSTVITIGSLYSSEGELLVKSFIFNAETNRWTDGPKLLTVSTGISCGRVRKNSQTQEKSVIVVGGYANSRPSSSVEILDSDLGAWRKGPDLPIGIQGGALVEDPYGGAVLIGGETSVENEYDWTSVTLDTLYRLPHAGPDASWELMSQKLKTPRNAHVAFLVPDNITNCLVLNFAQRSCSDDSFKRN